MAEWDDKTLVILNDGDEVEIEAGSADGTFHKPVVIWGVRWGRHFYIRSAKGPEGRWYQRLLESGNGRISARGICQNVTVTRINPESHVQEALDSEYHRKYSRYGKIVNSVVGDGAAQVTLQLTPAA